MDRITKSANENNYNSDIHELLFADDQCIVYESEYDLQEHVTALNNCCTDYDMKLNTTKTETLKINKIKEPPLKIYVEGEEIKQTNEYKYLGSVFTQDGKFDREIEVRIQKANVISYQLAPLLKHRHIPIKTKQQLINCIFIPTLCYQCQTWTINKSQEQKLSTCEMRCLRQVVNKTRRDKISNNTIRNMIGTIPCLDYIENQRLKWFGHITRMETDETTYKAFYSRSSGKKARGRLRKKWLDCVRESCQNRGKTVYQASQLAKEHIRI
jgi:hypothetical protein